MAESERKLIEKIKKGNQQAFKQLYDIYADYSLRTAYAITKNSSDASDIVQETFIRVFRNIDSYDHSKPFRPWFYQLLINESRRYLKRKSKEAVSVDSDELLDHLHHISSDGANYDELEWAIEQLDENHRTLLILKYMNGFTEKEIADVMDMNVNTIKSRLYKGRQRLRAIMGGAADE